MALVDYGSSEESEQGSQPQPAPKSKAQASKHGFQKLVDSSNPTKIRLNLEKADTSDKKDTDVEERPAKKAKLGGGGLKDFNSILPAPKRPAATNGTGRGGLGRGVSLKTGPAPGFTREPMPEREPEPGQTDNDAVGDGREEQDSTNKPEGSESIAPLEGTVGSSEQQPVKKATMFKPLSVARKPQRKRPPVAQSNDSSTTTADARNVATAANAAPKVSLFSNHNAAVDDTSGPQSSGAKAEYQPMLYGTPTPDPAQHTSSDDNLTTLEEAPPSLPAVSTNQDQSLDSIADSLHLTPSQKRQLLGRNASKSSSTQAIKVTNFNTDQEYASNEALRQAGETIQHNAVRPIQGGGKHSLKQLVNSAVGQKEALEEKFAEGVKNRKEGAGKYGW